MKVSDIKFTNEELVNLFEECKAFSERMLDKDSEMYKWFHNDDNIAAARDEAPNKEANNS